MTRTIPIVDMNLFKGSEEDKAAFAEQFGGAFREIGFAVVKNHPISHDLIKRAYDVSVKFFALPQEVKDKYEVPEQERQRGYSPFQTEKAKQKEVGQADLKEFWMLGREIQEGTRAAELCKWRNIWPSEEVPEFEGTMLELFSAFEETARLLLSACSIYIGEPENLLADMVVEGDTSIRMLHYPPQTGEIPDGAIRAAEHEDICMITLLCEAIEPGLQVQDLDGNWIPLQAEPGQLAVNAGDMLQNITNGYFKSTTHRVVNQQSGPAKSRYSMPFFCHPRPDVDITPLQSCVEKTGGKQTFRSMTQAEYLAERLAEINMPSRAAANN